MFQLNETEQFVIYILLNILPDKHLVDGIARRNVFLPNQSKTNLHYEVVEILVSAVFPVIVGNKFGS